MNAILRLINKTHSKFVFERRARVLSDMLAALIPDGSSVVDVGCGNGMIADMIMKRKPSVTVSGLEVLRRPGCLIDCKVFDGRRFPFEDSSFDVCMFVDVLHHAPDIEGLLREARRVSRKYVLIKDHLSENAFDSATLKLMDWVGNRAHGVRLLYNYFDKQQWDSSFFSTGLKAASWDERVSIYTFPLSLLFGRGLHFIALLERSE